MSERFVPTRFVNTLSCRDCEAQVMLDDAFIHANGVCFRCTDIVAKTYKSNYCKDCDIPMYTDYFASELVCPRCRRVEEVGETFPLSTQTSHRIKHENAYLKKQVLKYFRNFNINVPDELIKQVEVVYISLQDFYLTATRPSLTFLIPAILDLVLPFNGPLRRRFMLNTIYKDVNTENFTKTQLKTIHIWRSFLEHHGVNR